MPFDREIFDEARREFLSHLLYAKGHGKSTCYAYNGDLGIWASWLTEAGKDWQRAKATDVELANSRHAVRLSFAAHRWGGLAMRMS